MRKLRSLGFCVLAACDGDGSSIADEVLDGLPAATLSADPVEAKYWASTSAPNALAAGLAPYEAADLVLQLNTGETCPKKTETGTDTNKTTTYEGGCTTMSGEMWFGKATVKQAQSVSSGSVSVGYEGFGSDSKETCNGAEVVTHGISDGSVSYSGGPSGISFRVDLKVESESVDPATCTARDSSGGVTYSGRMTAAGGDMDGDGDQDATTWSGSGRFGSATHGVATVRTDAEVVNDVVCKDEASSGTTTISADGHTIAITYDGATDCKPEKTVRWSFDGADQGELEGVECNAGGASGFAMLAIVGLVIRRRRR